MALSLISWVQILMYSQYVSRPSAIAASTLDHANSGWATESSQFSIFKAVLIGIILALAFGSVEVGLVLGIRVSLDDLSHRESENGAKLT